MLVVLCNHCQQVADTLAYLTRNSTKKQVFADFSGWTDLVMAHLTKLRTLKVLNLSYQSDFLRTDSFAYANKTFKFGSIKIFCASFM